MAAAAPLQPFRFDRDFGLPMVAEDADGAAAVLLPSSVFTEDDLVRARTEGFAAGRDAGRLEAAAETAERTARVLDRAATDFADLQHNLLRDDADLARQATAVALAICRKVLPRSYQAAAGDAICQLVAEILPRIAREPQIRVRVAPALAPAVEAPLAEIAARTAFSGRLEVIGDPTVADGDCRIEWARGGVVRDWTQLWQAIDALLGETVGFDPEVPPFPSPSRGLPSPDQQEAGDA